MIDMSAEQLAQLIVSSIDRHGLRGLIYEAGGLAEVVMHGKVDMLAVAQDMLAAMRDHCVIPTGTNSPVDAGS